MTEFVPSDPTWHERVADSFGRQAMMRTLGVELQSVEPGEVVLGFGHDDRLTQQHGLMHGGVIGAVLDSACGWASLTLMPPGHAVLTVEYKINFLRPAEGTRFEGRARVVKPGRTLSVADAVLIEVSAPERPIATVTATLMALADRDLVD